MASHLPRDVTQDERVRGRCLRWSLTRRKDFFGRVLVQVHSLPRTPVLDAPVRRCPLTRACHDTQVSSRARFVPSSQLASALGERDALLLEALRQQPRCASDDEASDEAAGPVPLWSHSFGAQAAAPLEVEFQVRAQRACTKMAARHASEERTLLEQLAAAAAALELGARQPSAVDGAPGVDVSALATDEANAAVVRWVQDQLLALHMRHAEEQDALARQCEEEAWAIREAVAPRPAQMQRTANAAAAPPGVMASTQTVDGRVSTSAAGSAPPALSHLGRPSLAPPSLQQLPADTKFFPAAAVAALHSHAAAAAGGGAMSSYRDSHGHAPLPGSGYMSRPISPPHERLRMAEAMPPPMGPPPAQWQPVFVGGPVGALPPNPYYVPPPPPPDGVLLPMAYLPAAPLYAAPPVVVASHLQQEQAHAPMPADGGDGPASVSADAARAAAETLHAAALHMLGARKDAQPGRSSASHEPESQPESPLPSAPRRPRRSKYDYLDSGAQSPGGGGGGDDDGLSDVDLISPERRPSGADGAPPHAATLTGLPRLRPLPPSHVAPGPPRRGSSVEIEHGAPSSWPADQMALPLLHPTGAYAMQLAAVDAPRAADAEPSGGEKGGDGKLDVRHVGRPAPRISVMGVGSTAARVSVPSLETDALPLSSMPSKRVSWVQAPGAAGEPVWATQVDATVAPRVSAADVDASVAARVSIGDVASLVTGTDGSERPPSPPRPAPRQSRAPVPPPTQQEQRASAQALASRAAAAARQAGIAPLLSSMITAAARHSVTVMTPATAAALGTAPADAPAGGAVRKAPPGEVVPPPPKVHSQTFTRGDEDGDTSGDESTLSYTEAMPLERRQRRRMSATQGGHAAVVVSAQAKVLPPAPPALDPELGRIQALLLFRTPWSALFQTPLSAPQLLPEAPPGDAPPLACVGRAIQLWSVPTPLRAAASTDVEAQCRALCGLVRPGERLSKSLGLWSDGTQSHIRLHAFHRAGLACVVATHGMCPLRVAFGAIESTLERFSSIFADTVWRHVTDDASLGDAIATEVLAASAPAETATQARMSASGIPFPGGDPLSGAQHQWEAQQARPTWALPPVTVPLPPTGKPPASAEDIGELLACARHGHYKEAKALLKSEALASPDGTYGVDVRDEYGNTALMVACQNGQNKIAKMCVRYGADVNAQNRRGNTPLHFATGYGFSALADWLVRCGARLDLQNSAGRPAGTGIGQEGDF
jgi:hypothetical protein